MVRRSGTFLEPRCQVKASMVPVSKDNNSRASAGALHDGFAD